MDIRPATPADAAGMSRVLAEIVAATGRERPTDPAFVLARYVGNPAGIRCSVALDAAGEVLGFQSLIRAVAGNAYDVPEGWGIIGTHISPRAHRKGVGTALFLASRQAAREAGLDRIDAAIGAANAGALRYYEALGFRTYRERNDVIQKAFTVDRTEGQPGGGA
jgi:L-amino acid N-acyltransferase YncA